MDIAWILNVPASTMQGGRYPPLHALEILHFDRLEKVLLVVMDRSRNTGGNTALNLSAVPNKTSETPLSIAN